MFSVCTWNIIFNRYCILQIYWRIMLYCLNWMHSGAPSAQYFAVEPVMEEPSFLLNFIIFKWIPSVVYNTVFLDDALLLTAQLYLKSSLLYYLLRINFRWNLLNMNSPKTNTQWSEGSGSVTSTKSWPNYLVGMDGHTQPSDSHRSRTRKVGTRGRDQNNQIITYCSASDQAR